MTPPPDSDRDDGGSAEPARVDRLAIWLPVLFALALMAMAYWAASTWMGSGDEGAATDAGAAAESVESRGDPAEAAPVDGR